ncbi:MAG: polymer-forming cytoskeletal protein [Deltaproteobacteria bacterium]|jgi:cytoskeletal protein CcmA (bactofilin family)|nr:polymer-forming cytoskeletal protein [Deltaproteobacteria bacterium]
MPEGPDDLAASSAPPSLLRADARFEGLFALRAPARIDGCLRGEVIASDLLWIGQSARVNARVVAPRIVIEGEFDGEAEASGRIELLQTARVRARLDTPRLVLAEGCFFEGRCRTDTESEHSAGSGQPADSKP